MGFFDFIKKKKAEEAEGPMMPQPQMQRDEPPATASQLFDDTERAAAAPDDAMTYRPAERGESLSGGTVREESDAEELYSPGRVPEASSVGDAATREAALQEEVSDGETLETTPPLGSEELEDEVLPEEEPQETAEDEVLPEEERMETGEEETGSLPDEETQEALDSEPEVLPEGGEAVEAEEMLPDAEAQEDAEDERFPENPIEESDREEDEPEAEESLAETPVSDERDDSESDAPKKKFAFFGGKKQEMERFTAEPAENKKFKDMNRDLKDLKEERSAFASRFEKSYTEQNKQMSSSFTNLRQEVRQDISGLGREVISQNTRANGKIESQLRDQNDAVRNLDATMKEGFGVQNEQIESEGNKTRSEVQVGFARNKVAMQDMTGAVSGMNIRLIETQEKLENKLEDTIAVVSDRLQASGEKAEANKTEIASKIDSNTERILEKLAVSDDTDNSDIEKMTPAEHYKNMKFSIIALLLSLFSALLLLSSSLQILKAMVSASGAHPVVILDFILVYVIAVGALVVAFFQKKFFFGKGFRNVKEFFKSKNPAHSMSKISMVTSFVTICVNTVFLFAALIAFLIAMFAHGAAASALVAIV